MAGMLRAYAPALDGDYVAARSNLAAALASVTDPYVRAAGERLRAYALTDLGMFGNSLEAARAGLLHLPDTPETRALRSGLHDAMAYNSVRVGDYETALTHLERTVELDHAGGPADRRRRDYQQLPACSRKRAQRMNPSAWRAFIATCRRKRERSDNDCSSPACSARACTSWRASMALPLHLRR
jgi:hypothetical protein